MCNTAINVNKVLMLHHLAIADYNAWRSAGSAIEGHWHVRGGGGGASICNKLPLFKETMPPIMGEGVSYHFTRFTFPSPIIFFHHSVGAFVFRSYAMMQLNFKFY